MIALPSLPWSRVLTWVAFGAALYVLHDLFPILFLTFVIAYIAESLVARLVRHWPYRRFFTLLVFAGFLGGLTLFVSFVAPRVYAHYLKARRNVAEYVRTTHARTAQSAERRPGGGDTEAVFVGGGRSEEEAASPPLLEPAAKALLGDTTYREFLSTSFARNLFREGNRILAEVLHRIAAEFGDFAVAGFRLILYSFISAIFAFLIVWDLPKIGAGLTRLERGRFAGAYREIAPMVVSFGAFIGRAFEAQAMVAVVNTVVTSGGMLLLGVPEVPLLATFVFFCSFIPVFGVVVSTLPIAYFAFQVSGLGGVAAIVVLILVVHALEAYVINPIIYGHAFHAHPLLVLILLLVGEHFFGVWGLLLAVPVGLYLIRFVFLGERTDDATAAS